MTINNRSYFLYAKLSDIVINNITTKNGKELHMGFNIETKLKFFKNKKQIKRIKRKLFNKFGKNISFKIIMREEISYPFDMIITKEFYKNGKYIRKTLVCGE